MLLTDLTSYMSNIDVFYVYACLLKIQRCHKTFSTFVRMIITVRYIRVRRIVDQYYVCPLYVALLNKNDVISLFGCSLIPVSH